MENRKWKMENGELKIEGGDVDLRYPIGPFQPVDELTAEQRMRRIAEIESAPLRLEQAIDGLSEFQLDTSYRPGGWTIRQVVHHLPDSHLNGYARLKWALTEDNPVIKTYDQDAWASLPDSTESVDVSLALLDALHRRWAHLLLDLEPDHFRRRFRNPESGEMTIDGLVALYAWHGRHHITQIRSVRERKGW